MKREDMSDLLTFMAVAQENSFTKAAAKLGISQSAISHAIRKLETSLGVRLLNRTTRNVTCTEAGRRLLNTMQPAVDSIKDIIDSFDEIRVLPKGNIRLTTPDFAASYFLLPVLGSFIKKYPDINIEVDATSRMVDLIESEFDAGIRLGDQVEKDMIAVRIGADTQMVVAASPEYLSVNGIPSSPSELSEHDCINLRMKSSGVIYNWEFTENDKIFKVKVNGKIICNNAEFAIGCALRGLGIVCLLRECIEKNLSEGSLIQLLTSWTPSTPGFHIYYPSRKQNSVAFQLLIDEIRFQNPINGLKITK